LRRLAGGRAEAEVMADTVGECLQNLEVRFPEFREHLWNEQGDLHRFVNVYVNGEDIRFLQKLATPLETGDEVSIVPALAGG
jgi:molybdopterin synthase sulfur carrier subunit